MYTYTYNVIYIMCMYINIYIYIVITSTSLLSLALPIFPCVFLARHDNHGGICDELSSAPDHFDIFLRHWCRALNKKSRIPNREYLYIKIYTYT